MTAVCTGLPMCGNPRSSAGQIHAAFISQLTNFEARLFGDTDSVYLAEYVMETLPGWDASLEDVTKALRQFDNDVAKAMDMLCPSPSHEQEQAQQNQAE
jgi:hypothetical protein